MAIGIKVKKLDKSADPGVSKFFGDPTVPNAWADRWSDDVIFFCQLRLADIAGADKENRLPHSGYLYIFLDTEVFPYTPMVYYFSGEPDTVIDGFNEAVPEFSHLTQGWEMEFTDSDDTADGIRLFGTPSDWCYGETVPGLFMQFDPLQADMGFLDSIDGYLLFLYGEDNDIENISLHIECS